MAERSEKTREKETGKKETNAAFVQLILEKVCVGHLRILFLEEVVQQASSKKMAMSFL
jgi:hypothetical protein